MKKIKNIDILRRIITDPKILKRERRNYNKSYESYNNNNTSRVSENVV
jgi:putative ubiquitin-RnfH superfamily antitoxin RatB of RatAB toxin-antitoxin module